MRGPRPPLPPLPGMTGTEAASPFRPAAPGRPPSRHDGATQVLEPGRGRCALCAHPARLAADRLPAEPGCRRPARSAVRFAARRLALG